MYRSRSNIYQNLFNRDRRMNDIILKNRLDNILRAIKEITGLEPEQVLARSRKRPLVEARDIICHILKTEDKKYSLTVIGDAIGLSHCTVIFCLRQYNNLYTTDKEFKCKADAIIGYFRMIDEVYRQTTLDQMRNHILVLLKEYRKLKAEELNKIT